VLDRYFIIFTVVHYGVNKSRADLGNETRDYSMYGECKSSWRKMVYQVEAGYRVLVEKEEGDCKKPCRVSCGLIEIGKKPK
jgi:hypothetical protein